MTDLVKIAITGALSVLLTFITLWFTVVPNVPTRNEVMSLIQTNAPYIRDAGLISGTLDRHEGEIAETREKLDDIKGTQVEISTKLDLLLEREFMIR